MSQRFFLTPSAARDLDDVLTYVLEQSGVERARRLYDHLHKAFVAISTQPGIGHGREDLVDESLRVWPVFAHLIIYRPDTKPVQIIRVIHGARDVGTMFEHHV